MSKRNLKFVVVGEREAGKTAVIQNLLSGTRPESQCIGLSSYTYSPTAVCSGFNLNIKTKITHCLPNESDHPLNPDEFYSKLSKKQQTCNRPPSDGESSTSGSEQMLSWNNLKATIVSVEQKWPRVNKSSNVNNSFSQVKNQYPMKSPRKHRKRCASSLSDSKDNSDANVIEIEVDIWDTGGDKRFTWFRWFECTGADAVLVCVPLSIMLPLNRASKSGASRDLQKFLEDEMLSQRAKSKTANYRVPPILLVGTKSDLCIEREKGETASTSTKAINRGLKEVCDYNQAIDRNGLKFASEIEACDFISCSAMYEAEGVRVFERALEIALTSEGEYRASKELSETEHNSDSQTPYFDANLNRSRLVTTNNLTISSTDRKTNENSDTLLQSADDLSTVKDTTVTASIGNLNSTVPSISFPPPPSSSPPSTCPPSSEISSSYSSTSSLESLCDSLPDLPSIGLLANTNLETAEKPEYAAVSEPKAAPPVPARRKLKKNVASYSNDKLNKRDEANFNESMMSSSDMTDEKPTPSKRSIKRNDPRGINRSRKTSEAEKFDKVFAKFLNMSNASDMTV